MTRVSRVSNVWAKTTDLQVVSGHGCRVVDVNGVEYLDFTAGIAAASTGHWPGRSGEIGEGGPLIAQPNIADLLDRVPLAEIARVDRDVLPAEWRGGTRS